MKKSKYLVLSMAMAMASTAATAATMADSRSVAMGGTGVASADFLTSSFHNPALGSVYRSEDDFGVFLPGVGAQLTDSDDTITAIEDIQDTYDKYSNIFDGGDPDTDGASEELSYYLDQLENNKPIRMNAGLGLAVAIPTKWASVNLYGTGYADIVALTEIKAKDAGYDKTNTQEVKDRYQNSEVGIAGVIVTEYGVAVSKQFNIYGQDVSFGVSPKLQQFESYVVMDKLDNFDLDNYDENKVTDNAFNLDLGVVWTKNNWRAGLAIKDVIAKDVKTVENDIKYEVKPKATLGVAYSSDFFVATLDTELTKESRFTEIEDDSQFIRAGVEANAWGWAQLRLGYAHDLEGNVDGTYSAGIGISPFDVVSLDVAATYAGENQVGASANLAFTF